MLATKVVHGQKTLRELPVNENFRVCWCCPLDIQKARFRVEPNLSIVSLGVFKIFHGF